MGDGIVCLCPGSFDGQGQAQALVEAHQAQLDSCKALILDMRLGQGGEEEDFWPLLPYVCKEDTPLAQLVDRSLMVNYTRNNCLIQAAGLQSLPGSDAYIQELVEKSGQGFLLEEQPETAVIPGKAPKTVIVLTDTWCRDEGERFAQAAQRAGAVLLGRATAGTSDFWGDVHYALDERYVLTWPTAVTKAAYEGHGLCGKGLSPDVSIPWAPAECHQDVLLERAVAYAKEHTI
jgi:C-terminal processing protease CtpA/Prc